MGKLNTLTQKIKTLNWATDYRYSQEVTLEQCSLGILYKEFDQELKNYFALAALSRSKTSPKELVSIAYAHVFKVRRILEERLKRVIISSINGDEDWLFERSFYGFSKKQGTSVRMPLTSCQPTILCSGPCYAHDVLDAAPSAVVRGVINGVIALQYETADEDRKNLILKKLEKHSVKAIKQSKNEVNALEGSGWSRKAYIRFSHIGEITAFSNFANALAAQVIRLSNGEVDCVVYTRHSNVSKLNPALWVINFTLDQSTKELISTLPPYVKTVFSAFGGEIDEDVSVNFLEHHRWSHIEPIGRGIICPATLPETTNRTCDAVKCDRCFVKLTPSIS